MFFYGTAARQGKIINMLAGPFSIESFSFFKMQIKTIKKKVVSKFLMNNNDIIFFVLFEVG